MWADWGRRSVCACLLALLGGCCVMPTGTTGTTDWPGVAPYLAGTWRAIDQQTEKDLLSFFVDGTGDPVSAWLSAGLLGDDLPAGFPLQYLLDGQSRSVAISGVPVTLSYVARARANKDNPSGPIAIGETVIIVVELAVYAAGVEIGTALVTFQGQFTQVYEANGSVRVIADLSSQAQQIADSFGIDVPFENLDETYSNVQLVRQ